ncbi:Lon protease 1 [Azoarcus sp. Aa7]|nr:Lon protease 1 [Azoarcus sp. Aa7]
MNTAATKTTRTARRSTSGRRANAPALSNALGEVRARIAALRVRSSASKRMPNFTAVQSPQDGPMVPVFETPIPESDPMTADRDVQKREEKIRTLLNERGALRLVGAVASAGLATSLESLYRTHPNFTEATDYVLGELALAQQQGRALCGLRILLSGPAGVGKTDYSLTLSRLLGLPMQVISMSSAQSSAAIGGSETYWGNTKPGMVWEGVIQGDFANPLFVLDELEKAATNWGDPVGALYQLLESATAAKFRDKSVPWLEVDCSRVNWIATVNDASRLHEALRSRFTEVAVTAPSEEQLRSLVQRLYSALLSEFGLVDRLPIRLSQPSEDVLITKNVREGKRLLRAALASALRRGATEIVVPLSATPTTTRRIGFV